MWRWAAFTSDSAWARPALSHVQTSIFGAKYQDWSKTAANSLGQNCVRCAQAVVPAAESRMIRSNKHTLCVLSNAFFFVKLYPPPHHTPPHTAIYPMTCSASFSRCYYLITTSHFVFFSLSLSLCIATSAFLTHHSLTLSFLLICLLSTFASFAQK